MTALDLHVIGLFRNLSTVFGSFYHELVTCDDIFIHKSTIEVGRAERAPGGHHTLTRLWRACSVCRSVSLVQHHAKITRFTTGRKQVRA
jgi:hypothetical protein